MPVPPNEGRSLTRARARRGLRSQIAAYRQELECGSPYKARREWLDWQIRKAEKRLSSAAGWAYLCPGDLPSGQAILREALLCFSPGTTPVGSARRPAPARLTSSCGSVPAHFLTPSCA